MEPYTYYMQIIQNEEKENAVMTLDSAMEKKSILSNRRLRTD